LTDFDRVQEELLTDMMMSMKKQQDDLQAAMMLHSAGAISTQHIAKMLGFDINTIEDAELAAQRNMDFAAWAAYKKVLIERLGMFATFAFLLITAFIFSRIF